MPTIKFTATPELPFDIAHLDYKAGDVVDLPDASCRRWIRRGVAEYHVVAKEMPRMVAVSESLGPVGNIGSIGVAGNPGSDAEPEAFVTEVITAEFETPVEPEALDPLPETDDARPEMPPPGRRGRPRK